MTHNPPMRIPISPSDKAWARLSGGKIISTNTTSAELPRRPWDASCHRLFSPDRCSRLRVQRVRRHEEIVQVDYRHSRHNGCGER